MTNRTETVNDPAGGPAPGDAAGRSMVRAAALIAAAQGVLVAVPALGMAWVGLFGDPGEGLLGMEDGYTPGTTRDALIGALVLLLTAAIPLTAGHGLWRLRRWGRGPALTANLFCLPVAYEMATNGGALVAGGVLLGLSGLAGLVLLLHPAALRAMAPAGTGRVARS
ncbi:hypothetical protein [Allostreptomyces psammosilenae]|uniref:Uncharacterized membrane protein (DUF2068 family) n=1 Tax=Allostreptomyces psammosilenae TaxID=1892865 RepID=A0A852ZX76_9ACTN|nr:hypothetical protein [Allostreptomyces psammosilenae]NYI06317.1 uncharacterized membrane protein (DUF2068 family) [Allostreptomyces psammosilenae]